MSRPPPKRERRPGQEAASLENQTKISSPTHSKQTPQVPALQAELPSIAKAKLPATYEGARVALAECSRIDECQDWADRAEALASYAKQAQDDELRKMADRIQARAIRRCGELLQQISEARGRPKANGAENREGTLPNYGRTRAATDAGLSEHRRKTAIRVSRIPDPEFEEAVEGDEPATVTALAERGIDHRAEVEAGPAVTEIVTAVVTESPRDPVAVGNIVKTAFASMKAEEQDRLLAILDNITKEIRDERHYAGLDPKTAARRKGIRERVKRHRQGRRDGASGGAA